MRKQDYLLALITSLNVNERRLFRSFASQQQDEANYLKLFDALEGKEQYNATHVRRSLNLSAAQLEKQKSYLAKVLLKFLRLQKDGVSFNATMTNFLLEIEELMGRRLYDYALDVADKALAHAEKKDHQYFVPAIMYYKLDIIILAGKYELLQDAENKMQAVQGINTEQQSVHVMLARVQQFEHSRRQPQHFAFHNHPLLKMKPEDFVSKRSLVGWFTMMNFYYVLAKKSTDETVRFVRKQVAIYEKDSSLRAISSTQHLYSYKWLASAEGQAGNYEKGLEAIDRLIEVIPTYAKRLSPATINTQYEAANVMRANLYFYAGRYQDSLALSIKAYATRHLQEEYLLFSLVFIYAKGLLHTGNAEDAVKLLDELLQMNPQVRTDFQPYLRPMLLLAHLHMGNYSVVPYLVKSSRAWMKRREITDSEVEIFFSHAYAIAKAPVTKRKEQWKKLYVATGTGMPNMNKELHLSRWVKEFAR